MEKPFNVIFGHAFIPKAEVQEPDVTTDAVGTVRVQFDYGTEALSICRIMGERKQDIRGLLRNDSAK